MRARAGAVALLAILAVVAVVVYGCGGSSSSSTGPSNFSASGSAGSSGATVQGQLLQGSGSAQSESVLVVVFQRALGIGVAEAAAGTPLADATVTLTGPGGPFTTQTDADGKFTFTGLVPGTYTLAVCVGTPTCVSHPVLTGDQITVGPADLGTVNGTVFNDTVQVTSVDIVAESVSAQGILQNDAQLCIASRIAQAANVSLGSIIDMRQQHMGWGKIAHQKGLSAAGVIGGGNQCDATQLSNIRAANGQGNGHANGNGNGNSKGNGKNKS